MVERPFFATDSDVVLVQEPYVRFQAARGYQRLKLQGTETAVKAEIWIKSNIDVTVQRNMSQSE